MNMNYELHLVRLDKTGFPSVFGLWNLPHGADMTNLPASMNVRLTTLEPNPDNPNQIRLQLTFTEK